MTLDSPEKSTPEGSDSIFTLLQENNLNQLVLVEDCPTGFLQAKKVCDELDIHLIFGIRFNVCADMRNANDKEEAKRAHKIIIFAKDGAGCILLNKIYTAAFTKGFGHLDFTTLKGFWQEEHLKLAIPFYDSFIFQNLMTYNTCIPEFGFTTPTFLIEDNGLPFDNLIKEKVELYCSENKYPMEPAKSIYYKEKEDFEAFQTYKCICSRSFTGRNATLSKPQLDHCGSNEFSLQSWLTQKESSY